MQDSKINWTHHTFNPWRGCSKVSEGCRHCYAEDLVAHRYRQTTWGPGGLRLPASEAAWREPLAWERRAQASGTRCRVFTASLADVFDDHPSIQAEWRQRLWDLIAATPHLDWLLLTKRPHNVERFSPPNPPPNAWLGFSAENQTAFDDRWPHVRQLPFRIRFLSYEPALGPIELPADASGALHWVIFGGETSSRRELARPADLAWARTIQHACQQAGIAFWFKQTGSWINGQWHGKTSSVHRQLHDRLDGRICQNLPDAAQASVEYSVNPNVMPL